MRNSSLLFFFVGVYFSVVNLACSQALTTNLTNNAKNSSASLSVAAFDDLVRQTETESQTKKRPSSISVSPTSPSAINPELRYTVNWLDYKSASRWALAHDLSEVEFNRAINAAVLEGLWLIDFAVYQTNSGQRFAAIWHENKRKKSQIVRLNVSQSDFYDQNLVNLERGYTLVSRKTVSGKTGASISAVWAEEQLGKTRFKNRVALDGLLNNYLSKNKIAGISVAITKNGQAIYTRGHGFADKENRQRAHSNTVYPLGNISQSIAAVLALRLEEKSSLSGGIPINLSLSWASSHLILGMPKHHTHTVEQLLAHSACLNDDQERSLASSFRESGGLLNSRRFVSAIWHKRLLSACQPGKKASYAGQGYAYAAAVLETATGKSVYSLLREELFRPLGLQALGMSGIDRFRSTCWDGSKDCFANIYRFDGELLIGSFDLQPLAEGIEGSVIALSEFLSMLRNNRIISRKARDQRLWAPFYKGAQYGMGWQLASDGALKQGSDKLGTSARLMIDRQAGTSIVLLSNQQNPSDALNELIADIRRLI